MAVCGSIVLGHPLSMRVIKTTDGQAACKLTLLEWPFISCYMLRLMPPRRVRQPFPVAWMTAYC